MRSILHTHNTEQSSTNMFQNISTLSPHVLLPRLTMESCDSSHFGSLFFTLKEFFLCTAFLVGVLFRFPNRGHLQTTRPMPNTANVSIYLKLSDASKASQRWRGILVQNVQSKKGAAGLGSNGHQKERHVDLTPPAEGQQNGRK